MSNYPTYESKKDFSGHSFGNYRLIRLLGHGRFASVYLGEHQYLERLAAIKVLHETLTEEENASFLTEVRLLATLSHPHIVRVLEYALAPTRTILPNSVLIENIPFLAMEYIPGGNLRTMYPSGTHLSLDRVLVYVQQIADALQYAHTLHIIHRDIKPENLLVNERQEVMLSDFGMALFAPQTNPLSRCDIVGTYPYTAPEQLQGKPLFASDQYSLAILAYEWLCGHPPFVGREEEIIMQHISSSPPPLHTHNISVPPNVENALLKALAKDPSQRYETVQAFVQALQESAQQRPYTIQQPFPSSPPNETGQFPLFYYLSPKPTIVDDQAATGPLPLIKQPQQYSPSLPSLALRNRQRMVQRVRSYWITDVLEPSLHEGTFISPRVQHKPDAVAQPALATSYPAEEQNLTSELSILEIYEQAGGELLILGEAGTGKTTLLLQLARSLLTRAEQDESFPLPVIFPLASWAEKQLPLQQWLLVELTTKYRIPCLLAEQWLASEALLPLFDGLDEVADNMRPACITALNTYKQQHQSSQMVVCSRLTEYLLFPPRVLLRRAVVVQTLTRQQVDAYFQQAGTNFDLIAVALRSDPLLYDLIKTPLMVSIVTLAYQDRSPIDLLTMHSFKERYQHILTTYTTQMLHRHPIPQGETSQSMTNKIAYLAQKMQQNNQTIFYVEQLQPQWIDRKGWLTLYMWLAVLLPGALIGALTGMLLGVFTDILAHILHFQFGLLTSIGMDAFFGIVVGYLCSGRPLAASFMEKHSVSLPKSRSLQTALFVGLTTFFCMGSTNGWIVGLINGALFALLSIPLARFIYTTHDVPIPNSRTHTFTPPKHLINGLLIGGVFSLISITTLLIQQRTLNNLFPLFFTVSIRDGVRCALWGMLLSLNLQQNDGTIRSTEIISWSWHRFFTSFKTKNSLYNLLIGLIIGFLFGGNDLFQGKLNSIFSYSLLGIVATLGMTLTSAVLQGISSNKMNDRHRHILNEGIKRSLSYGILGFVSGTIIFLAYLFLIELFSFTLTSGSLSFIQVFLHPPSPHAYLFALVGGILTALLFGWLASWQHGVLRIILRCVGSLPLNLARFLNFATESIFLRRAGGGYLFIHQALAEYFASLNDARQRHTDDG